jgi:hypothetical protein
MTWANLTADVNAVIFETFALAADYIPPGAAAIEVRAITKNASEVMSSAGYPELRPTVHVLAAEVPKPAMGALFRFADGTWAVDRPPELRDGVWIAVVRRSV